MFLRDGAPLLAAIDVIDLPSDRKADISFVDAADSGKPVYRWLEEKAALAVASQQKADMRFLEFRLIQPTNFDVRDKQVRLRSLSVALTPDVKWFKQTIQLDASTGIYDWVRGRLKLGPGTNSYTINKLDLEKGIPMTSPPVIGSESGLQPGDIDFSLTDVQLDFTTQSDVPDLDGLILEDDLAAVYKGPNS